MQNEKPNGEPNRIRERRGDDDGVAAFGGRGWLAMREETEEGKARKKGELVPKKKKKKKRKSGNGERNEESEA